MGALELRSYGMGGVADPKINAPPHMSYQVKFDSSAVATNGVRINRRKLPKMGSDGVALWDGSVTYS